MQIGSTEIADDNVYFIAEAGINHNGSLETARELIDTAADAGADAVKFQTFDADRLVTADSDDYDAIEQMEIKRQDHEELQSYSERQGVTFLSTPFDRQSADLLAELSVPAFKIGSGELNNLPLLRHVAGLGEPMIVSTGMGTLAEVKEARDAVRSVSPSIDLAFLECTSSYPTPVDKVNLQRIRGLQSELPEPIGFSDHTLSVEVPGFAVATGAVIVEKHFTLDRSLKGPDHEMSLEPDELSRAVSIARDAATAKGSQQKSPSIDAENREAFRKSVHSVADIEAGDIIDESDIALLRPGTGIEPEWFDEVIGATATRAISSGEPLTMDDFDG